MKVLVTGATGFIGKRLVEELIKNKFKVICLVRKTSNLSYLQNFNVRLVYCDISNEDDLKKIKGIIKSCSVIYHLAALLGRTGASDIDIRNVNVLATKNLLKLCNKQKFIFCSSVAVYGTSAYKYDEQEPHKPTSIYGKTKVDAEKLVLDYNNYVIVRPYWVYGPEDILLLRIIKAIKKGFFAFIGKGNNIIQPIYVGDLVRFLADCINKKNEIYIIAGNKITMKDLINLVADKLNVKRPKLIIPKPLFRVIAYIVDSLRLNLPITKSVYGFFTSEATFNTEKAKKINLKITPIEEGIEKTIEWYRNKNLL